MTVGLLKIHIHLHGIGSLKAKRQIVKSLIGRLKSRFNFSIAEIEAQDSKSLAVIGLTVSVWLYKAESSFIVLHTHLEVLQH